MTLIPQYMLLENMHDDMTCPVQVFIDYYTNIIGQRLIAYLGLN